MGNQSDKISTETLKQLGRNKQVNYGDLFPDTLKVLGSTEDRAFCADLIASKSQMLELIESYVLLYYCNFEEFTSEEFKAFRKGLRSFPDFFTKCFKDLQQKEDLYAQRSEKIKKDVDNSA